MTKEDSTLCSLARLLTIAEVANLLHVSTRTVRRMIKTDELVAHRIGRQLRISEGDLRNFIRLRRET